MKNSALKISNIKKDGSNILFDATTGKQTERFAIVYNTGNRKVVEVFAFGLRESNPDFVALIESYDQKILDKAFQVLEGNLPEPEFHIAAEVAEAPIMKQFADRPLEVQERIQDAANMDQDNWYSKHSVGDYVEHYLLAEKYGFTKSLTIKNIDDAMKTNFWLDADALAIIEAATIAGYINRISQTQAAWNEDGLARARVMLEPEASEEKLERYFELLDLCNQLQAFECEGVIFEGQRTNAVARYVGENPSKKFFIWLQDNFKRLN